MTVAISNATSVYSVHARLDVPASSVQWFDLMILSDAQYKSICFESIKCTKCASGCDAFADSADAALYADTLYDASKSYKYESVIEHTCPTAQGLADGSNVKSYTCLWNGTWSPTQPVPAPQCDCESYFVYFL